MAERSSGPVKPPVIDLTARAGARPDGDKPEAGPAPSPRNDNPPRDALRPPVARPNWLLLGSVALGGAVLGTVLTYGLATIVPLPSKMPPDLSAEVGAQGTRLTSLETGLATLTTQAGKTQVSLDATIAQLDQGLNDANAAIAAVKAAIPPAQAPIDLAPLETEITTIKAQIDAISAGASGGDASAIAQSIATLQTGLDALSTRLNGVDATVSGLRSDVDAARKSLADHIAAALPSDVGPALKLPLILSGLASAFEDGKPFTAELATLRTLVPDLAIPDAIAAVADAGLVRPDMLTQRFELALPDILAARETTGQNWSDSAVDWAKSLLALRPAQEQDGDSPDAVVSRLEGAMTRHDYAAAQDLLAKLPAKMQTAAAVVAPAIAAHAAAEELLAALRARALSAAEATP